MMNAFRRYQQIKGHFAAALVAGLILGIGIFTISPLFLLAGVAGVIYLVVAVKWPEIALLGILFLTSTIIDIYSLPSISIGVGHLIISDFAVIIPLGIILIKALIQPGFILNRNPLNLPLIGFYGIAMLSTGIAIYQRLISFNESLGEVRTVNFYLLFIIVTNLVRSKKQLLRLYRGIIILAILVAFAMIAQYTLGPSVPILPGRVETLNTAGAISAGVARVLPPGQSLVMLGFVCLVVQLLFDKTSSRFTRYLILLGIVGLAVILTFNRSFWVAIAMALFLAGLLVSSGDKVKYVKIVYWTILVGALALTPLLAVKGGQVEELVKGAMIRMSSLFNPDTTQESSLVFRYIENEYALPQIESHPLIGLGLGAQYRPYDPRLDDRPINYGPEVSVLDDYVHNGHLWVMLKTGLIGYLFFMWFLITFIKRAFQNWGRILNPTLKGIVLAFAVTIAGLLVAAFVNPIFKQTYWTPVIGIMLGMSEIILGMNHDQPSDLQKLDKSNLI